MGYQREKVILAVVVLAACLVFLPAVGAVPPVANFQVNGSNTNVTKGQNVTFQDMSTGVPTSWLWEFGDGDTATNQTAFHKYGFSRQVYLMRNGYITRTVSLTACNADGCNKKTKPDYVNLSTPLAIRPTAVATLGMLNESAYNEYLNEIGGNTTVGTNWTGIDFVGAIHTTFGVYAAVLTPFLVLILAFALPFIMLWIVSKDFVVSGILGMFEGIFIIVRLPSTFMPLAVLFIGLSITAIVYSLYKERV